jgi:Tfp pilus assembly protein PilF
VYGEITGLSAGPNQMFVELRSLTGRPAPAPSVPVNTDGSFEFRHIEPGMYQVIVMGQHGDEIRGNVVSLSEQSNRISIPLRVAPEPHRGTVSLRRLGHKPPKQAQKEFRKAEESLRRGDAETAIAHLRQAVAIDPQYLEAQNNLGVRYLVAGQLEASRYHLDRALALDDRAPDVHGNLAALALHTGDAVEAERRARRFLSLGGDRQKGSYLLGLALARQDRTAQAIPLLEDAAVRFPRARLALADVLAKHGDTQEAQRQLKVYLESPQAERRVEVERWMNSLRAAPR